MNIAVCADHRGFQTKEMLKTLLQRNGHQVTDFGSNSNTSCDYPDFAVPAAKAVAEGKLQAGIMICGTGIGMSISANKVHGVRAALCHDELMAELSRKHTDANVLCLPADLLGEELIKRIVEVWLHTPFEGGRHERRLQKIHDFEVSANGSPCPESTGPGVPGPMPPNLEQTPIRRNSV